MTSYIHRELVQSSNGGRTSDICSDGPCDPAKTRDNRSSGKVCTQGQPVKHTRSRCDTSQYTDDQVDDISETGEYVSDQVVNTNERGEYRTSRVKNDGQVDNTSEVLAFTNVSNNGTVSERYHSSAFIQLAPRHETNISDVLNTHDVCEYRNSDKIR